MNNLELKPNLAKAVIAVMKEVDGVEKGMTVGTGKSSYKGVSDKDVKQIFKKALVNNGLCILPIGVTPKLTIERWEEADTFNGGVMKTKQSAFTEVTTQYLLLHESGESEILVGYGHGVDSQDKGAGKATTYALKYTLLYTFLTPTGDLDDSDKTHSEQVTTPKTTPKVGGKTPTTWLNKGTEPFNKAVDALKAKTTTVDKIKEHYKLSKEVEAELSKIV